MLGERPFAGFWPRLGAGAIDWLIVIAALWLTFIVGAVLGVDGGGGLTLALFCPAPLLPPLYFGLT
jgi:uncharacterized RDD family membrane protein YckC